MWIGIAIGAIVVVALSLRWAWRRGPQLSGEMRRWQNDLDVLGRTANQAPVGGPAPSSTEPPEVGDTVHVIGRRER